MTGLHELLPVCMYVLYQYGPMTELRGSRLGCLILAITELIFYIHGEGRNVVRV
jgi:hypothetical protein